MDATDSRPPDTTMREIDDVSRRLLRAIKERSERDLIALAPLHPGFSPEINQEQRRFIYDNAYLRNAGRKGATSLLGLIRLGPLHQAAQLQDNGSVTVYFVPRRFLKDTCSDPNFFESAFMIKYFACEFTKTPTSWRLDSNFCFAETDFPWSSEEEDG